MTAVIAMPATKAAKKIKPPLRKSELIEALAIRERENIVTQNEAIGKQLVELRAKFQTDAIIAAIRADGKVKSDYAGRKVETKEEHIGTELAFVVIELELPATAEMRSTYRRIKELEKKHLHPNYIPSLHELKRKIRESMAGHTPANERVNALLKDKATLKALDATLEALKQPAQLAIAG